MLSVSRKKTANGCLIGIDGKRASQLVTLARWRMDAVLVRCNAVSKTCSKVEPVEPTAGHGVEKLQLKNPLRTTCHFLYKHSLGIDPRTNCRLQHKLRGKTSVSCCIATAQVTHEEARHQCKKPKRSRMTWSRKFCVAQAIQTLCSHEECHVVQFPHFGQIKHLILGSTALKVFENIQGFSIRFNIFHVRWIQVLKIIYQHPSESLRCSSRHLFAVVFQRLNLLLTPGFYPAPWTQRCDLHHPPVDISKLCEVMKSPTHRVFGLPWDPHP